MSAPGAPRSARPPPARCRRPGLPPPRPGPARAVPALPYPAPLALAARLLLLSFSSKCTFATLRSWSPLIYRLLLFLMPPRSAPSHRSVSRGSRKLRAHQGLRAGQAGGAGSGSSSLAGRRPRGTGSGSGRGG